MGILWYAPSIAIAALLAIGALGSYLRLLAPERGFSLFLAGLLLAALALPLFGGAAAVASTSGRAWRPRAVRAAILPLLVMVGIMLPNLARVNPQIHDITTDPADTLAFQPDVAALRSDALGGSPARDEELALQREHYADVQPLELGQAPDRAFTAALAAAEAMPGWEITLQDAAGGRIEAVATSRLFHFKDDVLIRVQPTASASRIDVRSRSRVGRSDLGANAARIRTYLGRLRVSVG